MFNYFSFIIKVFGFLLELYYIYKCYDTETSHLGTGLPVHSGQDDFHQEF